MFSNKSKLINERDRLSEEVTSVEQELAKVQRQFEECTEHSKQLDGTLQQERKECFQVVSENHRLTHDIFIAEKDLVGLKQQMDALVEPRKDLTQQREKLMKELAADKQAAKQAHELAKESAEAARKDAVKVRAAQDEQLLAWKAALESHEALTRQVEAGMQQRSQAISERDSMRERWASTKEELFAMRKEHELLKEDFKKIEERLAEQQDKRGRLEQEVKQMNYKLDELQSSTKEVETNIKKKNGVLKSTTYSLQKKRDVLSKELGNFTKTIDEARGVQNEREASDLGDKPTKSLLPRNFGQVHENLNLQAQRANRQMRLANAIEISDLECDVQDMQRQQRHRRQTNIQE